ncbi:MAG TPA: uroporphyrinogen-III synthase [Opitutaceae bacterium]|jgi:uroporphyrinogen-III synthase
MSATSKLPLSGRRVVVTRTRDQASDLAARLVLLGADAVELPVIRISHEVSKDALADVMLEFGSYDWLVFTSANGVQHFFQEFLRLFDDIRSLGLIRIASVGETTAKALKDLHLKSECVPARATADSLATALIETGSLENSKILVVTGNLNRDGLDKRLTEAGAIVDDLQVYKTEAVDLTSDAAAEKFRLEGADAVLFASSSSAQSFADQGNALRLSASARKPLHGSIGPQTSETMKKVGMKVDFEASTPGIDELVTALIRALP